MPEEEEEESPSAITAPCYDVYETKDGEYVTIAAREDKFWEQLLEELGREGLVEYQFATGEDAEYARGELQSEFETKTRDEWEEYLSDETMFAPVNEFDEVFDHPQLESRKMVREMDIGDGDTFSYVGFPAKSSSEIEDMRSPAPEFGEHTRDVLSRVLSDERLAELEENDII